MHPFGVILLVALPCLLGGWAGPRWFGSDRLAGLAVGLFAAFAMILALAVLAATFNPAAN